MTFAQSKYVDTFKKYFYNVRKIVPSVLLALNLAIANNVSGRVTHVFTIKKIVGTLFRGEFRKYLAKRRSAKKNM